ncbi:TM2 domain-containing protein [Flavobacterium sp. N502536]|uniref:TM2 domain-containing protein n=1 Tax=Flavobacterium sp. N502536 TaxID=2986837 RepID=UPI002223835A|nr:TM2 domain-containing protein [Flavobacterium sp. N502536]
MENSKTEHWNNPPVHREENKKVVAGILAILLGFLGIHKFYLGYNKEGIIYLTRTDEEFYQTYQVGQKGWF